MATFGITYGEDENIIRAANFANDRAELLQCAQNDAVCYPNGSSQQIADDDSAISALIQFTSYVSEIKAAFKSALGALNDNRYNDFISSFNELESIFELADEEGGYEPNINLRYGILVNHGLTKLANAMVAWSQWIRTH